MKKTLRLLSLAALAIGLLGSCSKIDERISNLEKRIDGIESNQIASIKSQVDAINTSIADLGTIRQNVQTLMNTTPSKENIEELRRADEALGRRIDELKSYTDGELTKYATTEWVKATFATLEQHQWTCDTIAKIDARIGALDAKLSQSISGLESSLKQWVNEQLDAYYTAAQMDAKLGVMQAEIDALKNSKDSERIDSLATELTKTKVAVDSAKTNIRSEYKAAIQSAIETSEGKLTQALKDSIAKVNDKISALDTRVTSLEIRMQAVEGKVDNLEAAIGAYTELQGTITEIIKKLIAEVGDKPQSEQDTTIWKCITALQAQCGTIGTAIETLQGLVGNKDVATQISEAIASLITTQKLEGLADAVSALKDIVYGKGDVKSLTEQIADINEKLSTTYVTKTQLGQDIATAKADLQRQIDSLCNVIGKDGTAETATGIFKKIAELNAKVAALEAVNITIGSTEYTKWSDAVQAVLNKVNALGIGNISGLQSALNDLDARLDKIEAMIQSVTILPAYTDGSVEAVNGMLTIDFVVSPAAAVKGVTKDSIKVLVHQAKVQTKAASYESLSIESADVNEATGDVTITADISKITPAEGKGLTVAVNIKNGLSDFTTEFVPVTVTTKPIVTVTFDLNGITGTAPETQKVAEDSKVTKPADPTDMDHTFAGWYKTKDATTGALSDPWDFDNDTVTADMTLYAKWTRTLVSIYTNSDIPKVEDNTAPDNAWENGDGGKAFIAYSTGNTVLYLYKKLEPSGAKQLPCRKTENFTKIGDDYVFSYGTQYGVFTLHMTEGKFTSVTYDGTGTTYEELSGTYTAAAPLPAGALKGVFSVSATKKVYFSKGNLQATYNSSASTYTWGFAANQYSRIGKAAGNTTIDTQTDGAVVDLFGWSTSTNGGTSTTDNYGIKTSTTDDDYSGEFYDWGKAVGDGSTWRTLSKDEWTYLFNNHSKKWATVNDVKGYVIAPDGFAGTLSDTYADDAALAANNLVFLPAAGDRYGSNVYDVGDYGFYWSSSAYDENSAYSVFFFSYNVYPDDYGSRDVGSSVRLITESK